MIDRLQAERTPGVLPRKIYSAHLTPSSPYTVARRHSDDYPVYRGRDDVASTPSYSYANSQTQHPSNKGKIAVLVVLGMLSLGILMVALDLSHVSDDRAIPAKVKVKLAKPLTHLAFSLIVISAIQTLCVVFLGTKLQGSAGAVQPTEITSALEPLDVSRILKKRDNLSTEELTALLKDMACELREAKTIQRYLIEKASHVVCTIDANSRFISVSRACLSAWGYSSNELEGTLLRSIVEDSESVFNSLLAVHGTSEKAVVECKLKTRDGELLDIVWTAYWSKADQALFCVAQDITERKRVEQLRNDFLAMVTHDLRTPIASLQGVLVLLNKGVLGQLNGQGQKLTEKVSRDFDRLQRLISNMLEIDKIESGGLRLERSVVPLMEVLEHGMEVIALHASTKNLTVNAQIQPCFAFCDRDQMVRVVLNLLSNAVKYAPDNSAVDVKLEDMGDLARVSVTDRGRGIPADRIRKIFEKFEQVDGSDAKQKGGTGLGLAICKAIICEHGGQIGADSEPGVGSTFWVTIPKRPVECLPTQTYCAIAS